MIKMTRGHLISRGGHSGCHMAYTEGHMTLTGDHAILLIRYHCFSMTSLLLPQHVALHFEGRSLIRGPPTGTQLLCRFC